jgi:hypothetical protein
MKIIDNFRNVPTNSVPNSVSNFISLSEWSEIPFHGIGFFRHPIRIEINLSPEFEFDKFIF